MQVIIGGNPFTILPHHELKLTGAEYIKQAELEDKLKSDLEDAYEQIKLLKAQLSGMTTDRNYFKRQLGMSDSYLKLFMNKPSTVQVSDHIELDAIKALNRTLNLQVEELKLDLAEANGLLQYKGYTK